MRIFFVVTKICRKFKKNSIWMHSWQGLRMRTMKIIRWFFKIKFFQQNWSKFIWNRKNEPENRKYLVKWASSPLWKKDVVLQILRIKNRLNTWTEREGRKSQLSFMIDTNPILFLSNLFAQNQQSKKNEHTQNVIRIAWNNCKIANPKSP